MCLKLLDTFRENHTKALLKVADALGTYYKREVTPVDYQLNQAKRRIKSLNVGWYTIPLLISTKGFSNTTSYKLNATINGKPVGIVHPINLNGQLHAQLDAAELNGLRGQTSKAQLNCSVEVTESNSAKCPPLQAGSGVTRYFGDPEYEKLAISQHIQNFEEFFVDKSLEFDLPKTFTVSFANAQGTAIRSDQMSASDDELVVIPVPPTSSYGSISLNGREFVLGTDDPQGQLILQADVLTDSLRTVFYKFAP